MSRTSRKLRTWRQDLHVDGALVAGDRSLREIVYGYRFPSRPDRVKIGYSSRGLARVAEQSTSFPEKPEVVFVIHHPRAREIEKSFHLALAHRQADVLGTEWFDVDLGEILSVSPFLRRAKGYGRWRVSLKLILTLGLIALAGLAYALSLLAIYGISQRVGFRWAIAGEVKMITPLQAGRPIMFIEQAWLVVRTALSLRLGLFTKIVSAAPFAVLPALAWIKFRRQAF